MFRSLGYEGFIFIKYLNFLAFIRIVICLALLTIAVHPLQAQGDKETDALLLAADELIVSNQLDAALEKTRLAILRSPSSLDALQKRINVYYLMNNEKESLHYVEEALKEYPRVPEFYYLSGVIQNGRGKYIKALNDFDKALELQPQVDIYKYYLGRGVSHMNLMEYDQAISDFSTSIEYNDTVASAYHSRAMVNYEVKDYSAAVSDFLKALELSEGNAALFFNLGMSYYRLEQKEKACPYFHKACKLGNNNACRMTLMECAKAIPVIP
jgi:tetratricopeptide (TPR) repeat protein